MNTGTRRWIGAWLLGCAAGALACGVCVEDKVAATYDHAVVQRALAGHKVVVFCELQGRIDTARIRKSTAQLPGLDASTIRVSANPGALSFVLDADRQSPQAAVSAIVHKLPRGTTVKLLRVVG